MTGGNGQRSKSLDYVTSVDLWSDIIAMEYPLQHILRLLNALFLCKIKRQCLLSFYFYKEKERLTGEGCVGVDIPWQLCQTIGPLLSQRFPLASAKAQPRGGLSINQV